MQTVRDVDSGSDLWTGRSMIKCANSLVFGAFLWAIAVAIAGPCSAEENSVSGNLIAHWNFEDGDGNVVKDSSGAGNDGTIVPAKSPEPKWGRVDGSDAVSFSGGFGHFIRIPPSASLNSLKRQITIVAFIYPRSLWAPDSMIERQWKRVVRLTENLLGTVADSRKTQSSNGFIAIVQRQWREARHPDQYYLGYGVENNVLHYKWHLGLMGDAVSLYRLPKGKDKPQIRTWVHLAGTYNGKDGKMALYVDGELIGTRTHIGEIRLDPESLNRPLVIGAELNGPSTDDSTGNFDGYIQDVRVYDRALSDKEVKTLAEEARRRLTKR